jgi:hypothetical protein
MHLAPLSGVVSMQDQLSIAGLRTEAQNRDLQAVIEVVADS